jgi:hypothetical protein
MRLLTDVPVFTLSKPHTDRSSIRARFKCTDSKIEISSIDKFMFVGGTQIKQQDANNFAFALLYISIIR